MNKNEIKIYVVSHKDFIPPKDKIYVPIFVGKNRYNKNNILYDNTKENISDKNNSYCELTALYWIWKNDKSKYIGLCHYRRYFTKFYIYSILNIKKYLQFNTIEKIFRVYDMILPNSIRILRLKSLWKQYDSIHYIEDMKKTKKIIKNIYPDYIDSFEKVFKGNKFYAFNMFIAKKSIMDNYFKWLFNILFRLEKEIDISNYDEYQKRVYGFIAERLFNVWIMKNKSKLKIKELPVINTEGKIKDKITNRIDLLRKS